LLAVTSLARDRGRAFGIVAVLVMSAALVWAPMVLGAGDPIASGTFKLKRAGNFKKQLKRNHVKMRPKALKIRTGSSLDPTTGAGTIRLGKIKFKKGGKKVVYSNVKARLGANGGKGSIRGSGGKIFKLRGGTLTRVGFGAALSGVKVRFFRGAAKKINRKLDLHSLHRGKGGKLSLDEQPKTVVVLGGTAFVDTPLSSLPGGANAKTSVTGKLPSHCVSPLIGVTAIDPGKLATLFAPNPDVGPIPPGNAARFKFPITGGTISPAGNDGVIQVAGGVRLATGKPDGVFTQPAACPTQTPGPTTSNSYLDTTALAPNLGLLNVQSNVFIGGLLPGCWAANTPPGCGVFPGDKGIAIGQVLDASAVTVSADPNAKTVAINGAKIKNNPTSTTVLGGPGGTPAGLFPNATSPYDATEDFKDGDLFGNAILTVNTR
jgi:hypothetical protein